MKVGKLDLPLEINLPKGLSSCRLEDCTSFARQEIDNIVAVYHSFFKQVGAEFHDEVVGLAVSLESEFFCNEA